MQNSRKKLQYNRKRNLSCNILIRTFQRFWINVRKDIYTHVDNCRKCSEIKGNTHTHTPSLMLSYPVPSEPWERIHIGTLELPMLENGFKYLFVVSDYFFKILYSPPYD